MTRWHGTTGALTSPLNHRNSHLQCEVKREAPVRTELHPTWSFVLPAPELLRRRDAKPIPGIYPGFILKCPLFSVTGDAN
jgi:hypothetical protein